MRADCHAHASGRHGGLTRLLHGHVVGTVTDLALHEGGGWQAGTQRVAQIALGVKALAGAGLAHPSGAQIHALCWWRREQRLHILIGIGYSCQIHQISVQDLLILCALGRLPLALIIHYTLYQVVVLIQHLLYSLLGDLSFSSWSG